jgi:hypothetical protein
MTQEESVAGISTRRGVVSRIGQMITRVNWELISPRLLGTVCLFILLGLLVAGLWPFHSPRNQVTWSTGGNGLQFGTHGTILSSGKFHAANRQQPAPCSMEIWLEPAFTAGSGTLLAFYAPGSLRRFSLDQSISDFALRIDVRDGRFRTRTARRYAGKVFRRGKPLFITVTSNGRRTLVYLDGVLAETAPNFPLSWNDFDGELVIATSPTIDDSWSGTLRGLAFYDQELSPSQVFHHYGTWTGKGQPEVAENERPVALYLFDEHAGRIIHNKVPSGIDLYIPDRYVVLDEVFLKPFWEEYYPSWSYWDDVMINIAGFVPFGFLFCAYFSLTGRSKRPAMVTILLGFMVSLTIESLQAFLPTRDSGTTDLITNTLGTCLGVGLYRWNFWRAPSARIWERLVGISGRRQRRDPIAPC